MDFTALVPAGLQNPRIKQYLAIKKNSKSNPENLTCLEGLWELSRALGAGLEVRAFFVCPELLRGDAGAQLAQRIVEADIHAYTVSAKVMERIVDRDEPDGLAAIVQLPRYGLQELVLGEACRLVVLDGLEIPGNVGTIIRCADGAGANAVVITNRRTRLSHPKLIHASMGSSFSLPVIEAEVDAAVAWLRRERFRIITADAEGTTSYRRADYRGRVALVLGSERYGIMRAWHAAEDARVRIPMSGRVDSLNVGNAAVLLLYEAFCQQEPEQF